MILCRLKCLIEKKTNIPKKEPDIKIHKDTNVQDDSVYIGYKGETVYNSGVIFMPYVSSIINNTTVQHSNKPEFRNKLGEPEERVLGESQREEHNKK